MSARIAMAVPQLPILTAHNAPSGTGNEAGENSAEHESHDDKVYADDGHLE